MPFINLPHLHLLMNHVPTVGTVVALGLFILSLARRSEHLKHAALEVFFLIALATLPVYLTGVAAQLAHGVRAIGLFDIGHGASIREGISAMGATTAPP